MHELTEDLDALQDLLDRSYERAGAHLRSIFTPDKRLTAKDLAETLTGVQVLHLATVTRSCEPRVAPVDGLFYRGRFWFGSSPTSTRFRHIRERPQVSATHARGEALAVIVHGTAVTVDLRADTLSGFRAYCEEVYGPGWREWGLPASYARIEPKQMFTYRAEA